MFHAAHSVFGSLLSDLEQEEAVALDVHTTATSATTRSSTIDDETLEEDDNDKSSYHNHFNNHNNSHDDDDDDYDDDEDDNDMPELFVNEYSAAFARQQDEHYIRNFDDVQRDSDEYRDPLDGAAVLPVRSSRYDLYAHVSDCCYCYHAQHRRKVLWWLGSLLVLVIGLVIAAQLIFFRNHANAIPAVEQDEVNGLVGGPVGSDGMENTESLTLPDTVGGYYNSSNKNMLGDIPFLQIVPHIDEEQVSTLEERTSDGRLCFQEPTQLQSAVDLYLSAMYEDANRMPEYDELIGSVHGTLLSDWCLGSQLTDLSHLFDKSRNHLAALFNEGLNAWDVSRIQYMRSVFHGAALFNQTLSRWNTSSVVDMSGMFDGAVRFNNDLSAWDTARVQHMKFMFKKALLFSQPLNNWNVARVESFDYMFQQARSFNQPLDQWNTASARTMTGMFTGAARFNQPIAAWNVSLVQTMDNMFRGAAAFQQDLCAWGPALSGRTVAVKNMFLATSCLSQQSPVGVTATTTAGPFCSRCAEP